MSMLSGIATGDRMPRIDSVAKIAKALGVPAGWLAYGDGPAPDWPDHFISAYATSHPWEDWAETWAHYLHVIDALDTAEHWGLHLDGQADGPAGADPAAAFAMPFRERLTSGWLPLARFLNSMSRSLGHGGE